MDHCIRTKNALMVQRTLLEAQLPPPRPASPLLPSASVLTLGSSVSQEDLRKPVVFGPALPKTIYKDLAELTKASRTLHQKTGSLPRKAARLSPMGEADDEPPGGSRSPRLGLPPVISPRRLSPRPFTTAGLQSPRQTPRSSTFTPRFGETRSNAIRARATVGSKPQHTSGGGGGRRGVEHASAERRARTRALYPRSPRVDSLEQQPVYSLCIPICFIASPGGSFEWQLTPSISHRGLDTQARSKTAQ